MRRNPALSILVLTIGIYAVCQLILMRMQLQGIFYEDTDFDTSTLAPVSCENNSSATGCVQYPELPKASPDNLDTPILLRKYKGFMRVDTALIEAQNFAFSAFFSNEGKGNVVRVLTLGMRTNKLDPTLCQLYGSTNTKMPSSLNVKDGPVFYAETTRTDVPEHHQKKYGAAYFTCKVPYNMKPVGVSLTTERCGNPSNFIPIQYPERQKWQFTVCVTPLNYRYSKAFELVEMIEMNRVLGADHFVFYNYSTHVNVDKVLQYYTDIGVVDVVQWHLPMKVDVWPKVRGHTTEIHYFGQLGALNDCLYRYRYRSKYLVYQDLDEFIFPYKHANWSEMINSLPTRGVYMFRNTFFRKDFNDTDEEFEGKDIARKYKSVTLLKTMREAKIFGLRHRSKYILNPRRVDTVGIHNIWRERSGSSTINVTPAVALLHHYRNWENPHDTIKREEDNIALQFKDKLLNRLKTTWGILKGVPLGPLGF